LVVALAVLVLRGNSNHAAQPGTVVQRTASAHTPSPQATAAVSLGNGHAVNLPKGWTAHVWAHVNAARFEAWTPQGDLLVSAPGAGKVWLLVRGAHPGDPPSERLLISGLNAPQGLALDRLNGQEVLYVAESSAINRYVWKGNSVGPRTVVVGGLPDDGSHPLKEVVVARDHTVYFDIGSASNYNPPSGTRPPRATVMSVAPNGRHLRVFATGIRNGDGLSFAPDGSLWTAVNQRDDMLYPFHRAYAGRANAYGFIFQSFVNNHPPDEVARLTRGRNVGWPYCDPDPDLKPGSAGSPTSYANMRFDADPQTNPDGRRLRCSRLPRVERGLPAHSAPLGFHFLASSALPAKWAGGAVVAVHGSWDRDPPRAPAVLWMPWEAKAHTLGPARTLVGGFQNRDGSRWGRPADAVPGPDGALYVSDDTAGAIYRIVP
jgi:glucose/arabinose dehydrogenase